MTVTISTGIDQNVNRSGNIYTMTPAERQILTTNGYRRKSNSATGNAKITKLLSSALVTESKSEIRH